MPKVTLPPAVSAERAVIQVVNEIDLSYYADTSGSGTPLVLIHSINAAASVVEMKPLFERYRGQRPTYAPDLPGFGFSDRSEREYTPELYAQSIVEFLQKVVGESADVVALSLGCEFVARAALRAPELFHSLTFISPTGFSRKSGAKPKSADIAHTVLKFPLVGAPLFTALRQRRSIRYFLNMSFVGEPPQTLVEYALKTADQPKARNAPLHFLSGRLFTYDARTSLYEKVTMPTLILYDNDPYTSFDTLPELLESRPNWQATRIPNTLGLPHWKKLPEVTDALNSFWTSL